MEGKIVENQNMTIRQRVLQYKMHLIMAIGVAGLILLSFISYLAVLVSGSEIYPNVKVMNVEVGRLEKAEAINRLVDYYSNSQNAQLVLKTDTSEEKLEFGNINLKYDFETAVNNAYMLRKDEGFFEKFIDLLVIELNGKSIDLPISYDLQTVELKLNLLEDKNKIQAKDDIYEIKNDKLVFFYGHPGKGIDKEKALKQIEDKLKKGIDAELVFKETNINPKILTADSISAEPKDATVRVENFREIKFIPEVFGATFDKEMFNKLYRENKGKEGFSMPAEAIRPKLTLNEVKSKIFKDVLVTHNTYYGSSPQNRKHNIQLAASKTDGVILGPGDEFSYNTIVGPRTAVRGFQMAHVFSNGKVIDDFGGGICQVSTTIYDAVLRADLEVTSRTNHMFTVGYAKPGLDATVSYGSIDFKFKNNKPWPIKIVNNTTLTDVNFTIFGTNDDPEKKVEFRREIIKVIPHNTITTLDANLFEDKIVTDQAGSDGYVVNVYKITKRAGIVEKEEFMHKDTYKTLDAKVRKGIKPKQEVKEILEQAEPLDETPEIDINNQNTNTSLPTTEVDPFINLGESNTVE